MKNVRHKNNEEIYKNKEPYLRRSGYFFKNLGSQVPLLEVLDPGSPFQILTSCVHSSTCETTISDYHKMVYTFLKATFTREKGNSFITYICFQNFNQVCFRKKLLKNHRNIFQSFVPVLPI